MRVRFQSLNLLVFTSEMHRLINSEVQFSPVWEVQGFCLAWLRRCKTRHVKFSEVQLIEYCRNPRRTQHTHTHTHTAITHGRKMMDEDSNDSPNKYRYVASQEYVSVCSNTQPLHSYTHMRHEAWGNNMERAHTCICTRAQTRCQITMFPTKSHSTMWHIHTSRPVVLCVEPHVFLVNCLQIKILIHGQVLIFLSRDALCNRAVCRLWVHGHPTS